MNYKDYKNKMIELDLVESVESVQIFVDLIVVMKNIKYLDSLDVMDKALLNGLGVDTDELSFGLKERKDDFIRLAVKKSYPKKWAIENFGKGYMIQIEILKRNLPSRLATYFGLENMRKKVEKLT